MKANCCLLNKSGTGCYQGLLFADTIYNSFQYKCFPGYKLTYCWPVLLFPGHTSLGTACKNPAGIVQQIGSENQKHTLSMLIIHQFNQIIDTTNIISVYYSHSSVNVICILIIAIQFPADRFTNLSYTVVVRHLTCDWSATIITHAGPLRCVVV